MLKDIVSSLSFQFMPLASSDLPMMFEWLALPHVAQWWRETRNYQEFIDKYGTYIGCDAMGPFIVYHEAKPIGYISWNAVAIDLFRNKEYPDHTYGIDLFIADTDYIGKGYGTQLIKQFIHQELMQYRPYKIITDPELSNGRSIRTFEKAGFQKTRTAEGMEGGSPTMVQVLEFDPVHITH